MRQHWYLVGTMYLFASKDPPCETLSHSYGAGLEFRARILILHLCVIRKNLIRILEVYPMDPHGGASAFIPAAHIFSVLARPYKANRANIRVDNHNHHDEGPIAPRVSPLLPGASLGTGQPWCDPSINDPIVHEQYGYSSGRDEDGVGAGMFTFVLCQVVVVYILYCIVPG